MTFPVLGKDAVGKMVPHKRSMLLLDGVLGCDIAEKWAKSLTICDRSNIFYDETLSGIPGYVCFELMAQTISAFDFVYGGGANGEPKIGFILGVDHMSISTPVIPSGSRIETTIRQECAIGEAMFSFLGESRVDGKVVASATLMVFTVLHPEEFLR